MDVLRLLQLVSYDANTGHMYLAANKRRLIPDDTLSLTIYDPATRKKRKLKADKLAWMLFHQKELPEGYKLFHKDLNEQNFAGYNLWAIKKEAFHEVTEALNNLEKYLKLQIHDRDMLKWVVHYKKGFAEKRETFDDLDAARVRYQDLRFEYVKIINKFSLSV